MRARIVSSHSEAIVAPSLRPPDPDATPPLKRRLGFALLALGTFALVVGAFVSFGQWLFLVGSVSMVVGSILLRRSRHLSEKSDDRHKLYGQYKV